MNILFIPEFFIYIMVFFAGVIAGIIVCIIDLASSGTKRRRPASSISSRKAKIVPGIVCNMNNPKK